MLTGPAGVGHLPPRLANPPLPGGGGVGGRGAQAAKAPGQQQEHAGLHPGPSPLPGQVTLELETRSTRRIVITAATAFTLKTLLRHYAKQALTPQ